MDGTKAVAFPGALLAHAPLAVARLRSLYPDVSFLMDADSVVAIEGGSNVSDRLEPAILDALYREKIYSETLGMRQMLMSAVVHR